MSADHSWRSWVVVLAGTIVAATAPAAEPPKPADKPPAVAFLPETTRHPDPTVSEGNLLFKAEMEWGDRIPLAVGGPIMAIYSVKSESGIRAVNLRYRVVAKGVKVDDYPEEHRKIQHPRDDPKALVFSRLELKPFAGDPEKLKLGKFVPDLGLFEQSWRDLDVPKRFKTNVELYVLPGGKEAGGRYMLETAELQKLLPNEKRAKIEVGDTVEVYVEAFDNGTKPDGTPDRNRPAGYSEVRRKVVLTREDAFRAIRDFGEERRKNEKKP